MPSRTRSPGRQLIDPWVPPGFKEAEISVFGPGYGECLVVHLGGGEWMIVDSCASADHQLPALDYLAAIGVDTLDAIKLVVVTHWHDDHVRGISEVVARCPGAKVVCSAALMSDELLGGIGGRRPEDEFESVKSSSGVDEMRKTFNLLGEGTALWAIEGRLLHERRGDYPCRISALSPSDQVMTRAQRSIRDLVFADAS